MSGAEKLLGNGDMHYLSSDSSKPRRIQGVYVSEKEIKRVVEYISEKNPLPSEQENIEEQPVVNNNVSPDLDFSNDNFSDGDYSDEEMIAGAKDVILQSKKASASLLQRRLKVGYARAARILDILEEKGLIGPGDGAKPREVYADKFSFTGAPPSMPAPADMKSNMINKDENER